MKKANFLLSTLDDFPTLKDPKGNLLPEVALVGRSNVGKSSLINHLLGQKKLARTSQTPGKTQLLNFFLIDDSFLLVDLPGYGFAKAPPGEVAKWSEAIDAYLNKRKTLKLLLLLVDSRRDLSEQDTNFLLWAEKQNFPVLLIFTKTDKLSRPEKEALLKKYPSSIFYTVMNLSSKQILTKQIEKVLWG